jgi:hypothetical protein
MCTFLCIQAPCFLPSNAGHVPCRSRCSVISHIVVNEVVTRHTSFLCAFLHAGSLPSAEQRRTQDIREEQVQGRAGLLPPSGELLHNML